MREAKRLQQESEQGRHSRRSKFARDALASAALATKPGLKPSVMFSETVEGWAGTRFPAGDLGKAEKATLHGRGSQPRPLRRPTRAIDDATGGGRMGGLGGRAAPHPAYTRRVAALASRLEGRCGSSPRGSAPV